MRQETFNNLGASAQSRDIRTLPWSVFFFFSAPLETFGCSYILNQCSCFFLNHKCPLSGFKNIHAVCSLFGNIRCLPSAKSCKDELKKEEAKNRQKDWQKAVSQFNGPHWNILRRRLELAIILCGLMTGGPRASILTHSLLEFKAKSVEHTMLQGEHC